ncbi:MAG: sugar phosphate isomerase/epimerase [Acidobacteriaceae bacterium]|nr:sugar phosphate isomerase/epimerase [Acidobacteriaceae bacterium]
MAAEASLRCYMNLMALDSLPETSSGPHGGFEERMQAVRAAGFEGVQFAERPSPKQLAICRSLRLGLVASARINSPVESEQVAASAVHDGSECVTLHVGWGLESDAEAHRLIESILEASLRHRIPLYIETHRATICQDMWRTVQLVNRFPEIRFNGDFSHWYAGQEMVYGGFERKLAFIQPVLERVRFIHGRIASPGCIQVAVEDGVETPLYVQHFKTLWTSCFRYFLTGAHGGAFIFTPELLAPGIYYARTFMAPEGVRREESDRWQQSLLLKRLAKECFHMAQEPVEPLLTG